jgi:hypothetical protein
VLHRSRLAAIGRDNGGSVAARQRLPNGNTLVNEGWFGRFFEVTADGTVVWEYVNPYFGARQKLVVNAVQRAYRYTAEEIEGARKAT